MTLMTLLRGAEKFFLGGGLIFGDFLSVLSNG